MPHAPLLPDPPGQASTPPDRGATSRRHIVLAAAAALMLGGSGGGHIRPARAATATRLRIGGTGAALGAMRLVAEAFRQAEPAVEVEVLSSLGTSGGIAAITAGAVDVALAGRPLIAAERAASARARDYARTPLAFATHADTPLRGVTLDEAVRIYAGELATWPDGTPIRLVRRQPSDSEWTLLTAISPAMARATESARRRPGLLTTATDQDNADALQRLRGSFGMISLGQILSEGRRLTPLALDGVAPTPANCTAGRYGLTRTLAAVTRHEPSPAAAAFLAFLFGEPGRAILAAHGHEPRDGGGAA